MNETLVAGMIVDATVTSVEHYGVCIEYNGVKGLIKEIDISWDSTGMHDKMYQLFKPNDSVTVKVTSVTPDIFSASIKDVNLEDDPWSKPDAYNIGSIHHGVVDKIVDFGIFIKLEGRGATAYLPKEKCRDDLRKGEWVIVSVTSVDKEMKKISVELAK